MKKLLLVAALLSAGISGAYADSPVIRCDPNATGTAQYPNVSCTSNGFINVNASVSAGATSGAAANGAAVSGNPVLVAGYDGTLTRTLLTDTSGHAIVNVNGTVPVSGTFWQATQPVSGTVAVSAIAGALPTGSNLIGSVTPSTFSTTMTNNSGTITTGGTAQTLSTAKARHYLLIQNVSTGNLYINFTSAASAAAGSILLLPNAMFVQDSGSVTSELISVFGATTGQAYTSKED